MNILNDKLALNGNNMETAILQSIADIGDTVETTEGKKRVFTDKNGEKYLIFDKVRYDIKDYKEVSIREFLEKIG